MIALRGLGVRDSTKESFVSLAGAMSFCTAEKYSPVENQFLVTQNAGFDRRLARRS